MAETSCATDTVCNRPAMPDGVTALPPKTFPVFPVFPVNLFQ